MKRLELFLNRLYQRAKDDPYRIYRAQSILPEAKYTG